MAIVSCCFNTKTKLIVRPANGFAALSLLDTDESHSLSLKSGDNLTANRQLLIYVLDASKALTIAGNATISGTNTGDQTITLTGPVTGSGTGTFATTITDGAVTMAKIAQAGAVAGDAIIWDGAAWVPTAVGAGGTPGGLNTQLQYNNAGVFGGITGATTNGTVVTLTSPVFITPALGTPSSGNLANCTGYTVANLAGLGAGVGTWLATPSFSNLNAALTGDDAAGIAANNAFTGQNTVTVSGDLQIPLEAINSSATSTATIFGVQSDAGRIFQVRRTFGACEVSFQFNAGISMNGTAITSLLDPVNPQDAATKAYVDASTSAPGGADTQVQFNDGGAFGGDSGLTYNKTTDTLSAGTLNLTNALGYAFGGTSAVTQSAARANLGGIQRLSSGAGNSETDWVDQTPDVAQQIGITFNSTNRIPFLWSAGSTTVGDWLHTFSFPTGIEQIGNPDFSGPTFSNMLIDINGNPVNWENPGDGLVTVRNWSADANSSGSGLNLAVMTSGFGATAAAVASGGAGYAEGDVVTVSGGTSTLSVAKLRVTGETGGVITSAAIQESGEYTVVPSNPVSVTGGGGAGATFNLTTATKGVRALADNALTFMQCPSNRIASLMPGWGYIVFNHDSTYNKGFAICSPTIGLDGGNYSLLVCDAVNDLFRIPKWVSGKYQPSDSGWLDAMTVSPSSGATNFYGNVTLNDTTLAMGGGVSQIVANFGTSSVPSFTFSTQLGTGFYIANTSPVTLGITVATTPVAQFCSSGLMLPPGAITDHNNPTLEILKLTGVTSAVNELTVTNAVTGNPAILSASGGDSDISINLLPKGAGVVIIGGGSTASALRLMEASGSGTNYTQFVAQAQSANITYTLPPDDGDSGEFLKTDGSGSLTWDTPSGGSVVSNYMTGFGLSNNASDATNDIDIAAGYCADSTNASMLTGTAMTKRLDAGWAAGTNQGMYLQSAALSGTIASAASTTVTGTSTSFTTDFSIGDVIWDSTGSQGRRITAIASNTSLTVESAWTVAALSGYKRGGEAPSTWYHIFALLKDSDSTVDYAAQPSTIAIKAGTISTSGSSTTTTGSSTTFLTDFKVGDSIYDSVGGQERVITAIASNTSLTVNSAWTVAASSHYGKWDARITHTAVDGATSLSDYPSGYTKSRRLGAVQNDSSSVIRPFIQDGDWFRLVTLTKDFDSDITTARSIVTLTLPTGIRARSVIRGSQSGSDATVTLFTQLDETDSAISDTTYNNAVGGDMFGSSCTRPTLELTTNTSAQIGARASAAATSIAVYTRGWIDPRGQ